MAVGNVAVPTTIYAIDGITLSATAAGVRYKNRDDLVVIEIAENAATAVVTTKNAFCAAPVRVLREHFGKASPRYLVTNTGNANAGTGADGIRRATDICTALADKVCLDAYALAKYRAVANYQGHCLLVIADAVPVTPLACATQVQGYREYCNVYYYHDEPRHCPQ